MNLYSLARQFPTEESALAHLIKVRWPSGVRCVACDHDKCWPWIFGMTLNNMICRKPLPYKELVKF